MQTPILVYEFWREKNLFTYLAYSRKLITRVDFESNRTYEISLEWTDRQVVYIHVQAETQ